MKKYLLLLLSVILVGACSSENNEKAHAYWTKQKNAIVQKGGLPAPVLQALGAQSSVSEEDVKAFEEMMSEWEKQNPSSLPAVAQPVEKAPATATVNKAPRQIEAVLIVSSTCGWCQRLKQDRWADKFRQKYKGQIRLTEYDVNEHPDRTLLNKLMRKHKMTSVGTPTLFLGNSVVQGYPLSEADEAAQKEISKLGLNNLPARGSGRGSVTNGSFMEITLDDSPITTGKGKASAQDRQAMARALEKIQQDNQKTLQDIGVAFGRETQADAFAIISNSEKAMKRAAGESDSLADYLKAQRDLLKQQERDLNQLMQNNAWRI